MELEIKLVALPGEPLDDERVVRAASRIGRLKGPPRTIDLQAAYHDDPAGLLRDRLWTLRARREGLATTGTVKGPGQLIDGIPARVEREIQLARMPKEGEALPAELAEALRVAGLKLDAWPPRRFGTRVRRLILDLEVDGAVLELALDRGFVEAAGRTDEIREVELELKSGPPSAVASAAVSLARALRVRPGGRSKAERGLGLLGLLHLQPVEPGDDPSTRWASLCELEERRLEGAPYDEDLHRQLSDSLEVGAEPGSDPWAGALWGAFERVIARLAGRHSDPQ